MILQDKLLSVEVATVNAIRSCGSQLIPKKIAMGLGTAGVVLSGTLAFATNVFNSSDSIEVSVGKATGSAYSTLFIITAPIALLMVAICILLIIFTGDEKTTAKYLGWIKKTVFCFLALNLLPNVWNWITSLTGADGNKMSWKWNA